MKSTVQLNGRYVVEGFLGRGGMAEVFVGRKVGAEGVTRRVAIKRIRPDYCHDDRFRAMFVTEAQLDARLEHDNLVSILDFDEDETGGLFLVMELVDGIDLNALLRTGSLPPPVALFVASEVLQGLAYVHDLPAGDDGVRGLVHRDVSPQNILLSWDGAVKVSDFGIAKPRDATFATESTRAKGKLGYLSPEYANGLDLDGRSDLFAVGVVLWEMLVGEPLFSRANEIAALRGLLFEPYPSPRAKRPELPPDIEGVTMRLLERCRDDRYFTARTAIAALKDCAAFTSHGRELLSSLLAERFPDRTPGRYGGHATLLEPAARRRAAPPARSRSIRLILGTAAVTLAGIAVIAGLQGSGSGGPGGPAPSIAPPPPTAPAAVGAPPSREAAELPARDAREAPAGGAARPPAAPRIDRPAGAIGARQVGRRPPSMEVVVPAAAVPPARATGMVLIDLGGAPDE